MFRVVLLFGVLLIAVASLSAATVHVPSQQLTIQAGINAASNPTARNPTVTVVDFDGNVYQTVKIGSQLWMAENLKVTHYRNGDAIPNITDGGVWMRLGTAAYCNYNNDESNVPTYGRLYNLYAAIDPRGLAPAGWHVPTDAEWKQLELFLGMSQVQADQEGYRGTDEGGKLKESGIAHWQSPNAGATNESGFSALPAGARNGNGFIYLGYYGYFQSTTPDGSYGTYYRWVSSDESRILRGGNYREHGISVRCIKDQMTTEVTLLSVANESALHVMSHNPSFAWDYLADAGVQDSLQIEVGTDSDWAVAEMWSTGKVSGEQSFVNYSGNPLVDGVDYFVRVRVHAPSGWSDWKATSFHMNTPPTVPYPFAPTIITGPVGTTPALSVENSTDAEHDTLTYDFQIFKDSMLTQLVDSVAGVPEGHHPDSTTWTVTTPLPDNKGYYWQARAFDGYEHSAWSPYRWFIVNSINEPPSAPVLISPPDSTGNILYNRKPTLSWTYSTDPDPLDWVRFHVELALNPQFTLAIVMDSLWINQTFPPDSLPFGTHWWWRVSAVDRLGATTLCPAPKDFWIWQLGDIDKSHNCDIADLTMLIDYLYISFTPITPRKIADLDGDCSVDIADLTRMIDYLYISFTPLGEGCGP